MAATPLPPDRMHEETTGGMGRETTRGRSRPIHYADTTQGIDDSNRLDEDPYRYEVSTSAHTGWGAEMPPPTWENEGEELYGPDDEEDGTDEFPNPISDWFGGITEMIRGDAYMMFLGIATILIMLLIGILLAIR